MIPGVGHPSLPTQSSSLPRTRSRPVVPRAMKFCKVPRGQLLSCLSRLQKTITFRPTVPPFSCFASLHRIRELVLLFVFDGWGVFALPNDLPGRVINHPPPIQFGVFISFGSPRRALPFPTPDSSACCPGWPVFFFFLRCSYRPLLSPAPSPRLGHRLVYSFFGPLTPCWVALPCPVFPPLTVWVPQCFLEFPRSVRCYSPCHSQFSVYHFFGSLFFLRLGAGSTPFQSGPAGIRCFASAQQTFLSIRWFFFSLCGNSMEVSFRGIPFLPRCFSAT